MAKEKTLPKKLYIRWNTETEEPWLESTEIAFDLGEFGQGQIAGEYKLIRKVRITHQTKVEQVSSGTKK